MKILMKIFGALLLFVCFSASANAQDSTLSPGLELKHHRGKTSVEIPGPPPVSVKVEEVKGKKYRKTKREYGQSDRNHMGKKKEWTLGECGEGKIKKKTSREYFQGSACIDGVEYVCIVSEKITEKSVGGEVCSTEYELRIDCWIGDECESRRGVS